LWVDIVAGVVFAGTLEPEAGTIVVTESWPFTTTVGAVATAADGTLLVAEAQVLTRIDTDIHLSNGMDWTPDGTFYSIDTAPGVVGARDSPSRGGRRRVLRIKAGARAGMPLARAGNLWIAFGGGGGVECRPPAGELLAVVETGAPHTSSVTFAGPALD